MKTILVPTDFSANAGNALTYAIAIAEKLKAGIVLLHVYHIPSLPETPAGTVSNFLAVTENDLKARLDALRKEKVPSGITCAEVVSMGFVIDEIINTISAKKIDMVVMGTKGSGGLKEILIGSNTAAVVSTARCPVLAVPEKAHYGGIKKIVFATDYMYEDLTALEKVCGTASLFNAEVVILHVAQDDKVPEQTMFDWFKTRVQKEISYKNVTFRLLQGKNLVEDLNTFVQAADADMITMTTGGKDSILKRSMTRKMAHHTHIPLLALHETAV